MTDRLDKHTGRTAPPYTALSALVSGGRVGFLPARLLEPAQALLTPLAQITAVQSPPHAHGDIMVKTAHNTAWYAFTPASWALVFLPDDPAGACPECRRDWYAGCAQECSARIVSDEDVAAALVAAGLAGDWTAEQLLGARP